RRSVAVATATAVGLSPLFPAALAPPWEAAAFGVCAAVVLIGASAASRRSVHFVLLASAIGVALLVPLWLLTGSLSAATFGACTAPAMSTSRLVEVVGTLGFWLGPFALALAALGAFDEARRGSWPSAALAVVIAVAATG